VLKFYYHHGINIIKRKKPNNHVDS